MPKGVEHANKDVPDEMPLLGVTVSDAERR